MVSRRSSGFAKGESSDNQDQQPPNQKWDLGVRDIGQEPGKGIGHGNCGHAGEGQGTHDPADLTGRSQLQHQRK